MAWIAALVGLTALHSAAGSAYSDNFKLPHTQSFDAIQLLERNAPKASGDTDQVVIAARTGKLTGPAVRSQVTALLARIASFPHVTAVGSPYQGRSQLRSPRSPRA